MGAQTDLLSQRTREVSSNKAKGQIWRQFLGGSQEDSLGNYRLASPLYHLDRDDPPFWFVCGEKDDPSTRADRFRNRLEELGIESGLTIVPQAPHPFLGKQIWFDEMVESADRFFKIQLQN
jgi:pectinesterase